MRRLILCIFIMMVSAGCVETIVMDPHEKDLPVVVNCVLEGNSSKQSLTLQYAKGKSTQNYIPVEDAEVYITCESENPHKQEDTLSFVHVEGCLWEIEKSKRIRLDTEYTLHIEIPGRDHIWAKTKTLPSIRVGTGVSREVEEDMWSHVSLEEGARWPNRLDVNGSLEGCSLYVTAQEYSPEGWKDLDYLVTDHPGVDDFNIVEGRFSDVPLLGHPEDSIYLDSYYDTLIEMFYGIDQEFLSGFPLHKGILRISNLANGDLFRISTGPIWYQNVYTNYESKGIKWPFDYRGFRYYFYFFNNDLDEYLRSIERHTFETDHFLTTVYSTDPGIHSNINNGIGVFGCSYTCLGSFIRL